MQDPKSGSGSMTVLHHNGSRTVTHPLSAIWDGVEEGVNHRSAMEKLVLLSVSENEGLMDEKRERDGRR